MLLSNKPHHFNTQISSLLLCVSLLALTGCSTFMDRLDSINKPVAMTESVNPQEKASYKPMTWPMPENPPPSQQYANSLWQPGARAFFRDGRAARVGDILKVTMNINDKLQFNNQTEAKRTSGDVSKAPATVGLLPEAIHLLPDTKGIDLKNLVNTTEALDTKGTGTVQRQDVLTTQIAAIVTQLLPNGNMVINGSQEITMNQDVRIVSVKGVVRPQDIKSDNTIESTQIAEARITYTGKGQLNDVQKQRWGGQVVDALAPF